MIIQCVYIVYFPSSPRVKIGKWKGHRQHLYNRYLTPYGNDLVLECFETEYYSELEKTFFILNNQRHVCNELYDARYIHEYREFLNSTKDGLRSYCESVIGRRGNISVRSKVDKFIVEIHRFLPFRSILFSHVSPGREIITDQKILIKDVFDTSYEEATNFLKIFESNDYDSYAIRGKVVSLHYLIMTIELLKRLFQHPQEYECKLHKLIHNGFAIDKSRYYDIIDIAFNEYKEHFDELGFDTSRFEDTSQYSKRYKTFIFKTFCRVLNIQIRIVPNNPIKRKKETSQILSQLENNDSYFMVLRLH